MGQPSTSERRFSADVVLGVLYTLRVESEGHDPIVYKFVWQGDEEGQIKSSVYQNIRRLPSGPSPLYSNFIRAETLSEDRIRIEAWEAWADEDAIRERRYSRFILRCER